MNYIIAVALVAILLLCWSRVLLPLHPVRVFTDYWQPPSSPSSSVTSAPQNAKFPDPKLLESGVFCVPWTVNVDDWWVHSPEWRVALEHDEGQCFVREDNERTRFLRKVHNVLWSGNCSDVHTRHMWSSGWGADLNNVAEGILYAYEKKMPFQIDFLPDDNHWWHYAAVKEDGSNPACKAKDMFCYFFPLGKCGPGKIAENPPYPELLDKDPRLIGWVRAYATRPRQWLRHRVYKYIKDRVQPVASPCIAMHVRRADVVLHEEFSRRYFAISEYLDVVPKQKRNSTSSILLFTDDQNAVDEALEFHSEYNWIYLDRKRYRGAEGGWENQLPSKDPVSEVVLLHAIFELAKKCDTFVHTHSGFANVIYNEMQSTGRPIEELHVDQKKGVFSQAHESSAEDLANLLEKKRKQTENRTSKIR